MVGHRLSFSDNFQQLKFTGPFCWPGVLPCNRYDVISALKVLSNNRVAKIFIVCLHYEIPFFGIFHRFTNTIATKKTFRASLNKVARARLRFCSFYFRFRTRIPYEITYFCEWAKTIIKELTFSNVTVLYGMQQCVASFQTYGREIQNRRHTADSIKRQIEIIQRLWMIWNKLCVNPKWQRDRSNQQVSDC